MEWRGRATSRQYEGSDIDRQNPNRDFDEVRLMEITFKALQLVQRLAEFDHTCFELILAHNNLDLGDRL